MGPVDSAAVCAAAGLILMHFYGVGNIHGQLAARLEKRKLPATIYKLEIRAHIYGKCNSDGFIGRAPLAVAKKWLSLMQCVSYKVSSRSSLFKWNISLSMHWEIKWNIEEAIRNELSELFEILLMKAKFMYL